MALVILLRGVNVGGHRRFRPSALAARLRHLDVVNVGAAGTLVVRGSVRRAALRAELRRLLPFDAEIVICDGREILDAASHRHFSSGSAPPGVVRFVSVLSRHPRRAPPLPLAMPSTRGWLLKILARDGRFVFGVHRRHMKVIGSLGTLDGLFGEIATTRSASTVAAIAKVLNAPGGGRRAASSRGRTGTTGARTTGRVNS